MTPNHETPPAPDHAEIVAQIRSFIVDNFLLGEDELGLDDSLLDKGVVDSTGVLEVVAFLEEDLDIRVDDDDIITANLDSVAKLVRFVLSKRARALDATAPHDSH